MKIDRVQSCCSKTAEENAIKTSCIFQQQNSICIKWISYVTWTRFENAAVFFSRKFNIWSFFSTLCDYAIFSLIMRSDAARGQLCKIAPAHNIRSPVYKNPASHFLFILLSLILQYSKLWRIPLPRSSQILNPAPFFSEISDPEKTLPVPV